VTSTDTAASNNSLEPGWRTQVRALISLTRSSGLTELHVTDGGFALHLRHDLDLGVARMATLTPLDAPLMVTTVEALVIRAPQVGTVYLSSDPQGEPFVREGSVVEPGQVVGLIEAMKLVGEIESDIGGIVVRVLVSDGQAVEYGQPLYELA